MVVLKDFVLLLKQESSFRAQGSKVLGMKKAFRKSVASDDKGDETFKLLNFFQRICEANPGRENISCIHTKW